MRKIVSYILLSLLINAIVFGARKSDIYWENQQDVPAGIKVLYKQLNTELEAILPAPKLIPEPEYTIGTVNTLYWSIDSTHSLLENTKHTLLFFEVRALIDTTERWVFANANDDSVTYYNLPEGISINYQLRYYTELDDGSYGLSQWSEIESSIQDVDPPVLVRENSYVLDTQKAGDQDWIFDRTVQIRIVASDSVAGKISQVLIQENSISADQQIAYDFTLPAVYVDDIIILPLNSESRQRIELTWWIYDVAGQKSEPQSQTIYIWPEGEEKPSDVVCFPNPVCPSQGEIAKIKIGLEKVTKARIFDLFGNHISTITKSADDSFFEWNGKNNRGELVAQGGYLCVIDGDTNLYCKIAIIR